MAYGVSKFPPYYGVGAYNGFSEVFDVNKNQWYQSPSVFSDDFSTDTTGTYSVQTPANGSISWVASGALYIVSNSAVELRVSKSIGTNFIIGKKYRLYINISSQSLGAQNTYIGTSLYDISGYSTSQGVGVSTFDFIATATTMFISRSVNNSRTETIDNIAIYPINDDGSVDITSATPITESRNYLDAIVYADVGGQPTFVEQLPKIEYKKDLEVDTLKVHSGFDLNQKWYDVAASRFIGATYTNTTGKPIKVFVSISSTSAASHYASVDGMIVWSTYLAASVPSSMGFEVPVNSKYVINANAGTFTINNWRELK